MTYNILLENGTIVNAGLITHAELSFKGKTAQFEGLIIHYVGYYVLIESNENILKFYEASTGRKILQSELSQMIENAKIEYNKRCKWKE